MRTRILLIDDDQDEMIFLCEALVRLGVDHQCIWARSVKQALIMLQSMVPDVIIADYHMPCGNGIDWIRSIRLQAAFDNVPVLMHSSVAEACREDAITCGARLCAEKSANIEHYFRLVTSIQSLFIHKRV